MSNYTKHGLGLATLLATLPTAPKAAETDETFKFTLGASYMQTPSGDLDKFARDEVAIYDASMPGTTDFVNISHDLPLLTLGVEYRITPQLSLVTELGASSSAIFGDLKEKRTVDANTEQIKFGPTEQYWTQHLNLYGQAELKARYYTDAPKGHLRAFVELGGAASYINADSTFGFHVQANGYDENQKPVDDPTKAILSWPDVLNHLGAFQDMNSAAHSSGISYGATANVGLQIPVWDRFYLNALLGITAMHGNVDVNLKTTYPDANPKAEKGKDETRHRGLDNSGIIPTFRLNFQF